MEAARVPSQLLGQLFVEKGLITPEELEEALAEQQASGKRLGAILVKKGYVSGPALTTVLAEQLGVEMEKQEGYGSGLWSEIKRRHPRGNMDDTEETAEPADPTTAFERRLALIDGLAADEVDPQHPVDWQQVDEAARAELDGLRQQLTFAANRLDEERAAHEGTQRLLEDARAEAERLAAEAADWRERASEADDPDAKAEAAAALARVEETADQLRNDLAAREAELTGSAEARTIMEAEIAHLEAALDEARQQHGASKAAAAAATSELDELRSGFAAREAELAGSAAAKAAMEADLAQLQAALDELREQHSVSRAAAAAVTSELDAALDALAESEEARTHEAHARGAVEAELRQLQADARVLSERLENERADAEELRRVAPLAVELERERDELRSALEIHELELVAGEEARSREADARVAAEAELAKLQADTRALSQSLEEAQGAHTSARREVGRLESRHAELESEVAGLRGLLEEERALLVAAGERAEELEAAREAARDEAARVARLIGEREEALAHESERRAVLESQLTDLSVGADALNDRFQEECAAHVRTRQDLERVEAELAELQPLTDKLAATESELASCARMLAEVSEGLAATKLWLDERDFSDADTSRHLVFMPIEGVYGLAERPGPAPDAGADEEVDGVRFRVARIGQSPLPADKRRCAFLEVAADALESVAEVAAASEDHHRAG